MTQNTGVNPRDVMSPRSSWHLIDVLYEAEHWSLAVGRWQEDGEWRPVLAQRWNGRAGGKGNPVSRGFPTWFVLPDETYELYLGSRYVPRDRQAFVRGILGLPNSGATA